MLFKVVRTALVRESALVQGKSPREAVAKSRDAGCAWDSEVIWSHTPRAHQLRSEDMAERPERCCGVCRAAHSNGGDCQGECLGIAGTWTAPERAVCQGKFFVKV